MLRHKLGEIFLEWRAPFAECISAAQAQGELDTRFAPDDLAEFLPLFLARSHSAHEGGA
ncbi:MAG: hypothetical protein QM757_14845 [Paludibaculum sp.]